MFLAKSTKLALIGNVLCIYYTFICVVDVLGTNLLSLIVKYVDR